jgi:hypothetical protein
MQNLKLLVRSAKSTTTGVSAMQISDTKLTPRLIGYARVSTDGQSLDCQIASLTAAGAEHVFSEKLSGKNADRPALGECLASLKNLLRTWCLDRHDLLSLYEIQCQPLLHTLTRLTARPPSIRWRDTLA